MYCTNNTQADCDDLKTTLGNKSELYPWGKLALVISVVNMLTMSGPFSSLHLHLIILFAGWNQIDVATKQKSEFEYLHVLAVQSQVLGTGKGILKRFHQLFKTVQSSLGVNHSHVYLPWSL